MKKAYTITPAEYVEKKRKIEEIGYKNGWFKPERGEYELARDTPERIKGRFDKLTKEVKETPIPKENIFFINEDLYNLWLNRDTDEPITARELYSIVSAIGWAIKDAEGRAISSAIWDGM